MSVTLKVKATGQVFEVTTAMDGSSMAGNIQNLVNGKLYGGLLFDSLELTRSTGVIRLKNFRQWATFRAEDLEVPLPC
jgi:hypothetical protein